jgi:periplasmic protein TonB
VPGAFETASLPAAPPGARSQEIASARPAVHSSRSSAPTRAAAAAPGAFARKSGAEPGKKRRTSVQVEKRVEKVEVITRPPIIQRPRVRYAPKPTFPAAAKADEKEGFVRFRVQISPTGSVADVEILEADPPGVFDEAVKAAVRLWQFAPARDEAGKGIESSHEDTIGFQVEQAAS